MIFSILAICLAALASVTEASNHAYMVKRHVHPRSYSNGTYVAPPTLAPTAVSPGPVVSPTSVATNSSAPAPPKPTTSFNQTTPLTTLEPAASSLDFTTTFVQTNTKYITVTYTLGNGQEVVTTVTKCEATTRTVGHVKTTLTVSPILAAVPSNSPSGPSSPSSRKTTTTTTRTSTVTSVVYVTRPPSGTLTVTPKPTCAPSVTTVYVPSYITLYNTVTVSATASHQPSGPCRRNSTLSSSGGTTTRISTTPATIHKTVTLSSSRASSNSSTTASR